MVARPAFLNPRRLDRGRVQTPGARRRSWRRRLVPMALFAVVDVSASWAQSAEAPPDPPPVVHVEAPLRHAGDLWPTAKPRPRITVLRGEDDGSLLLPGSERRAADRFGVTPRMLAGLAGPGLRGARVTDIAPTPRGPWVATDGGGAAWWDGTTWAHLDARHGLPSDHLTQVEVVGPVRWFASEDGVVRIDPEGGRATWWLPVDDLRADAAGAWVLSEGAVRRLPDGDGPVGPAVLEDCSALMDWQGETVAACPFVVRLPGGSRLPELAGLPPDVTDLVPRRGGAWAITRSGLRSLVDGAATDPGFPAIAGAVDLQRVGRSLFVVDGSGALIRVDGDGLAHEVTEADGLPSALTTTLAPGPREGTAWVGTHRGLALVEEDGAVSGLPLSPLAVGRGARAVVRLAKGAAVLTDDGPVFLGRRAPRGWEAFAVAVGPGARDLVQAGETWLGLRDEAVFVLTKRGDLTRMPTGSRRAIGLFPTVAHGGRSVVVALREGVRAWVPGATTLGARAFPGDWRGWNLSRGGLVGWDDALVTSVGEDGWTRRGPAHDVAFAGTGWWVSDDRGVHWIDADGTRIETISDDGPDRLFLVPGDRAALWGLSHGVPTLLHRERTPPGAVAPSLPEALRVQVWPDAAALLSPDGVTILRRDALEPREPAVP